MAEDKQQQQPVASEPQKALKYEKDGDVKMTGVDNEDPVEGELSTGPKQFVSLGLLGTLP